MPLNDSTKVAMANRFKVTMTGKSEYDLGSWAKVEGLDVTWEVAEYRAGDAGNDRWYFPGNTKYTNVKLSRAVSDETQKVKQWLDKTSFETELFVATVALFTIDYTSPLSDWELRDVMPVKWSITGMDAGASQVALETLELAHRGFLNDQKQV
ncbi:phage tail protein [Amycolatopsis anabasis]|uniref:phage tail protein n=1 Tax=Amycolatopsis anabasis TaxID=1840409 RepID=UPI00131B10FA|nr:phage tail protein [Amycolatopsis anabasis]